MTTYTENKIAKMFIENTGIHFLDSGGKNGRMWQRNRANHPKNSSRVNHEIYGSEIIATVNVFHYFCEILDTDNFTGAINKIIAKNGYTWASDMEFIEELADVYGFDIIGKTINTYNHDNFFNHGFLFTEIEYDGEKYVFLQLHTGADIRGGYTQAQLYKVNSDYFGYVDIDGCIDGINVETRYNGYSLTTEDGVEIECNEDSNVELDFYIIE